MGAGLYMGTYTSEEKGNEGKRAKAVYVGTDTATLESDQYYGQATTGSWWMPWSRTAMKAVTSCDKPRGGAHILRSADGRMG